MNEKKLSVNGLRDVLSKHNNKYDVFEMLTSIFDVDEKRFFKYFPKRFFKDNDISYGNKRVLTLSDLRDVAIEYSLDESTKGFASIDDVFNNKNDIKC